MIEKSEGKYEGTLGEVWNGNSGYEREGALPIRSHGKEGSEEVARI